MKRHENGAYGFAGCGEITILHSLQQALIICWRFKIAEPLRVQKSHGVRFIVLGREAHRQVFVKTQKQVLKLVQTTIVLKNGLADSSTKIRYN